MTRRIGEFLFHNAVRTLLAYATGAAWFDRHKIFAVFFGILFGILCWLTTPAFHTPPPPAKNEGSRVPLRHRPGNHPPRP